MAKALAQDYVDLTQLPTVLQQVTHVTDYRRPVLFTCLCLRERVCVNFVCVHDMCVESVCVFGYSVFV